MRWILIVLSCSDGVNQVYNVAVHARTSLNALFDLLTHSLARQGVEYDKKAVYQDFRAGDVRHSQADISKARNLLGYAPTHTIAEGLEVAMPWYVKFLG